MTRASRGSVLIAIAVVALGLTGCTLGTGVTVPEGADALDPCPAAPLDVADLAHAGAPGCDLAGSSVTFRDGSVAVTVPPVGAVSSTREGTARETLVVNWGVPGVGVATVEDGRVVDVWASSPEALDLHRQQLTLEGIRAE